jgi:hypothetical protein
MSPTPYEFQEVDPLKGVKSEGLNKITRQIDENLADKSSTLSAHGSDISTLQTAVYFRMNIAALGNTTTTAGVSKQWGGSITFNDLPGGSVHIAGWLTGSAAPGLPGASDARAKVGINIGGETFGVETIVTDTSTGAKVGMPAQHWRFASGSSVTIRVLIFSAVNGAYFEDGSLMAMVSKQG